MHIFEYFSVISWCFRWKKREGCLIMKASKPKMLFLWTGVCRCSNQPRHWVNLMIVHTTVIMIWSKASRGRWDETEFEDGCKKLQSLMTHSYKKERKYPSVSLVEFLDSGKKWRSESTLFMSSKSSWVFRLGMSYRWKYGRALQEESWQSTLCRTSSTSVTL